MSATSVPFAWMFGEGADVGRAQDFQAAVEICVKSRWPCIEAADRDVLLGCDVSYSSCQQGRARYSTYVFVVGQSRSTTVFGDYISLLLVD